MTPLIFLKYDSEAIQAATAAALLNFKNAYFPDITLKKIGAEIGREASSIHAYICTDTEMPMSCWLKLTAKWPELEDRLIFHLDEAEKAFRARQRDLPLPVPAPESKAA